jgi:hypothetical protein
MKTLKVILSAAVMALALWLLGAQVPFMSVMVAFVAITALCLGVMHYHRPSALEGFANDAGSDTLTGKMSFLATAAIATKFLLGKRGATDAYIAVAGAGDVPFWVIQDEAEAAGDPVNANLLGSGPSLMVASAEIAAEADVYAAAGGKVQALPVASGTYWLVGKTPFGASGDGVPLLVTTCVPRPVTV